MTSKQARLVGAHEIRERLGGITRQRVYQITNDNNFPRPVATLAQGKVWLTEDVERWLRNHRPGTGGSDQPNPTT